MKKLALASAIVGTAMTSLGTHATPMVGMGSVGIYTGWTWDPITVPCASTWSGGADGFVLDVAAGTVSGTICIDPTGTGSPYVMLGISMGGNGSTGAIQIATDWNTTGPAWASYSVINIPTTAGIGCTTGISPKMTCTATLFGMPAILTI